MSSVSLRWQPSQVTPNHRLLVKLSSAYSNTSYPRLAVENPVDADSALQQGAPAGGRLIKPAHLADVGGYSSYFADPMGISGK